ncbi:MAG: peptide chain release factor N(5)-glutamine methyltransferase [Chloroflexi bacterium]|nr:peptide chain release factor N(5)-glutamine methyltransferase [Chloroflexota bacterium]MDQ3401342.1 peptide chain release factor N(5)-glutamine methyltransferase [Chloroflexota bacterium]
MHTRAELRVAALARLEPLDADVLLAHALGITKEDLYAYPEASVDAEREATFRALIERRAVGEPVAYLRGWKEFYGLRFAVDPRVLIPRPETEMLVDAVLASGARLVADVGTGSGAIAVAVAAHRPALRVIATDTSAGALEVARANAAAHGVADRIDFRQGDLLEPVRERVDAVAANLPYLSAATLAEALAVSGEGGLDPPEPQRLPRAGGAGAPVRRSRAAGGDRRRERMERASLAFEPRAAVLAGTDGLALIRRAIADLPRVLRKHGVAFFECDPPQARKLAAEHAGEILRDLAGAERVLVLRADPGGAMIAP